MSVQKYVITGHILEVYNYENYKVGTGGKREKINLEDLSDEELEFVKNRMLENYKNHNIVRAQNIRRLACSNFNCKSLFVTLTYDDKKVSHDIRNVIECNYTFKNFIKRFKWYLVNSGYFERFNISDLKYLAVIEFQDKYDRRAVHYHVLFNLPFFPNDELEKIWGMGFVLPEKINHVDNVGAYLIKYMTKDNNDERLMGKPAYLRSKNLIEPEEIICLDKDRLSDLKEYNTIDSIISNNFPIYENEYDTDIMGHIIYKQYNLERGESSR